MPHNLAADSLRFSAGFQEELVFATVPAASARKAGERIRGSTLDVVGTYTAKVHVASATDLECHLMATLNGATVTTDVYTTYADGSTKKTSFTGVGALVNATRQSSTFTGTKGVRHVVVSLVVTVSGGAVMTQAEMNGD